MAVQPSNQTNAGPADPRALALDQIHFTVNGTGSDAGTASHPLLEPRDQALYHELVQGVCREFRFLEWAYSTHVKKQPRGKTKHLLILGAYQLLFLDRVPTYAVYASVKVLAARERLSEHETKFIHGVLKSVEAERPTLMQSHEQALQAAREGRRPHGILAPTVLNFDDTLLNDLRGASKAGQVSEVDFWRSLALFKVQNPLVGYALDAKAPLPPGSTKLESTLAPAALKFESAAAMRAAIAAKLAWVQGEASQWACEQAALFLKERASQAPSLSVLEMATGKGGKCLGSWVALARRGPMPQLAWTAVDYSIKQIELFERDVAPLAPRFGVETEVLLWDWKRDETPDASAADLVWLDAPCSGIGTLSKHPEIALRVNREQVDELAAFQALLCERGWPLVKPGGALFYTVCTVSYPETFGLLKAFLARHPEAKASLAKALWPAAGELKTSEGFFGVLLHRPVVS